MSSFDKRKLILDLHTSLSDLNKLNVVPKLSKVYEKIQNKEDPTDEELDESLQEVKNILRRYRVA